MKNYANCSECMAVIKKDYFADNWRCEAHPDKDSRYIYIEPERFENYRKCIEINRKGQCKLFFILNKNMAK